MDGRIERRGRTSRNGDRRLVVALGAAAALMLGQAAAQTPKIEYPVMNQYHMPKPLPVKASKAEIARVDAETQALVDQFKAESRVALDYADRASGILIFPRIESSNYFLLGETRALGVLFVKGPDGTYGKSGYYLGERNSLGVHFGKKSASGVFMFMNPEKLAEFMAGDITARIMTVEPQTGVVTGDPESDIAAFMANVEGEVRGVSFDGLKIVPVSVEQE